jgi:hypothetical protein
MNLGGVTAQPITLIFDTLQDITVPLTSVSLINLKDWEEAREGKPSKSRNNNSNNKTILKV